MSFDRAGNHRKRQCFRNFHDECAGAMYTKKRSTWLIQLPPGDSKR